MLRQQDVLDSRRCPSKVVRLQLSKLWFSRPSPSTKDGNLAKKY
jgi:hypothetical protein